MADLKASTTNRLVNCKLMKECELWKGSMLSHAFEFGGVTESLLEERIAMAERCDDLTPLELEFLNAMKASRY